MISHFFKSSSVCRVLCVILAALTLAFTLSPALVQPAEAVAVADDLTLALTLLFTSWAGITFASNAGAQTAVSNLLSSKPAVASSVAGLITKGLVTEGSKLLLTGDVCTAFRGMLTDIQDFFQVKSEAVSSAGGGMLADNIVLGVFYDVPLDGSEVYYPVGLFLDYDVRLLDTTSGKITSTYHNYYNFSSEEADLLVAPVYKTDGGSQTSFFCRYYRSSIANARVFAKDDTRYRYNKSYQIRFNSFSNSVSFNQSKYITGTEAEELSWPETTITNPTDPSSPTEDGSENKIPVWPLGPQTSVITNAKTTDRADNDPGLDPEKMIEELRKLLQQQQPNPDPDPEPDPDPDPDPSDPDTPGGGDGTPPDFNGMMLPGLKDFFPFCIPFDLYNMMQALCAEPEAPKFQFATSFLGQVYTVDIDLSAWDNVAATIRYMVVAIYIVALAVATRKFIKW